MLNEKQLLLETELTESFEAFIKTNEEICVMEMHKIRDSVISTRYFMEGLIGVFDDLKSSYYKKVKNFQTKKSKHKSIAFLSADKKRAAVFISTSERFSGVINHKVFSLYKDFLSNNPEYEAIVVGRLTQDFANELKAIRQYKLFEISTKDPDIHELRAFIKYLVTYQSVNVFFGTYQSIITQEAKKTNISGEETIENELAKKNTAQTRSYIFEPSLEEILNFFETQIFASLFKQTLHESNLAQIGSRVKLLEDASEEIDKRLFQLLLSKRRAVKLKKNKDQLNEFSGESLWKMF